jgi:hypothetical protein
MTAIVNGGLPDEWLETAPIAALECRTLRHQWPRMPRPHQRQRKGNGLVSDGGTAWKILGTVEAGRLIERAMTCLGGCGTVRTETFLIRRDGRMIRDGIPRYRYGTLYLRKRADADRPLEPIGQDEILGMMVQRLYPKLRW